MTIKKDKLIKVAKFIFALIIFLIVLKESISMIVSFDINKFNLYADKLSISNLGIIIGLGIISYLPLSLYDFVLKKRVNINLNNKKLYKFSWIASSVASIAGLGGSTAIALKNHFYKKHVKDQKLLIKEVSKIVALNLTGFSMVSFVYILTNFGDIKIKSLVGASTIIISLYFPILSVYLIYTYLKGDESQRRDVKDAIKIIILSALEWIGTIVLIYSILLILDINVEFMKFFPIFVLAIIVAIASMSPGGIGSFDLTMILGLQALQVPSEKVLLVIFLYRISYYIVPLVIGGILYVHELWKQLDDDIADIVTSMASRIAHIGLIVLVFISGVILLVNEVAPEIANNVEIVKKVSRFSIINPIDKMSIILGFLLIAVSRLLIYKSKNIYKLTLVFVFIASITTIMRDAEYSRTIYLIIVAIILWVSKKEFYRECIIMRWGGFLQDILILLGFQILYLYTIYSNLSGKVNNINLSNYKIQQIHNYGIEILILSIIGFLIAIIVLLTIYYTNRRNNFPKVKLEDCEEEVNNILQKFEGSSVIHFIYLNDKLVYLNKDKDVLIQYQIYANKIVILGNPVGNEEKIFDTIQELYDLADKYGYIPVFCSIDESLIPYLHETGYEFMKLGEEARVDLESFTLEGRKMKSVRNALSRVEKENYHFEIVKPPFSKEFLEEVKSVSDEWLGDRKEKGFSVGFFDEEYLSREPIAIVKNDHKEIKGFTNLMPMYDNDQTLSIDLMRFSHDTCNGIMDFIFVNLFKWGQENGYKEFNMGMAPLSNVGRSKYSFLREKIALQVYLHGQHFYSFKGLKKFKEKYCESWGGRYMAYKKRTSLITTMIQVILLVSQVKED